MQPQVISFYHTFALLPFTMYVPLIFMDLCSIAFAICRQVSLMLSQALSKAYKPIESPANQKGLQLYLHSKCRLKYDEASPSDPFTMLYILKTKQNIFTH